MESLRNKKILYSGVGHMGLPGLIGLLQNPEVDNNDITVICGSGDKNNVDAIAKTLSEKGIEINHENLISRTDLDVNTIPKPDIVVLGIKPYQLEGVTKQYDSLITNDTFVLPMLAGVEIDTYKNRFTNTPRIARIMPHVPLASYGLYSEDKEAAKVAKLVFTGMGAAAELENEDQMHPFTAIAASGPAFIAQFVKSFDENSHHKAFTFLKQLAAGGKPSTDNILDKEIAECCETFHRNYVAASRHFLGKELATEVANNTIAATVSNLQTTHLSLDEYIASVRSRRGTTNAGLLFMGNCCPENANWGNDEQLASQKKITLKSQSLDCAESIKHAIVAATHRSIGSGQDASNPMHGIDESEVMTTVEQINKLLPK